MIVKYTNEAGLLTIETEIAEAHVENVPAVAADEEAGTPAVAAYTKVIAMRRDSKTGAMMGSAFMPRPGLGNGVATVEILTDAGVSLQTVTLG